MTQIVNSYTRQWKKFKRETKHAYCCKCNYCKTIKTNREEHIDLSDKFRGMTLEEYNSSK